MHPRRVGCHRDSSNALSDKLFKFLLERRHLGPGRQPAAAEDGNHRIDVFVVKLKPKKGNVWTCSVHVYRRVQRVAATLQSLRKDGVFRMGYRRRIYFTEKQKAEIWDRWQRGESMSSIGRMFDRNSSSIYPLLSRTGGIRPPERKRSRLALRLSEREEISRGLRAQLSLRTIARQLRRAPSTISREVRHNGGRTGYRAARSDRAAWDRTRRPKPCKFACRPALCWTVSVKLELKWSPQQIAGWLRREHPDDEHRLRVP